jgi:hypothetical protein
MADNFSRGAFIIKNLPKVEEFSVLIANVQHQYYLGPPGLLISIFWISGKSF